MPGSLREQLRLRTSLNAHKPIHVPYEPIVFPFFSPPSFSAIQRKQQPAKHMPLDLQAIGYFDIFNRLYVYKFAERHYTKKEKWTS